MAPDIVVPRPIESPVPDWRDYAWLVVLVAMLAGVVVTSGSALRTRRTQADGPRLDAVVLDWSYARNERYGNGITSTLLKLRVHAPDGSTMDRSVWAHDEITGLREGARTAVRADPRDPAYVELDGHPAEPAGLNFWLAAGLLVAISAAVWNIRHPRDTFRRYIVMLVLLFVPLGGGIAMATRGMPDRYPLPPPVTAAR